MPQAAVGGNVRYPSLQSIADLFRSGINDTFSNSSGSGTGFGGGAGLIMPNANPDLVTFMDSAIQEMFSDLRNVGDPELVIDNYILTGLPALTVQDATVQVSLAYTGYFDGYQWHPQWTLPIGTSKVLALWERPTGSNADFSPMRPAPFGLPGIMQGDCMGQWELREGQIWMPGAMLDTDLRLRARITYPTLLSSPTLNFATTYVPIADSRNAIVTKMLILYAKRFAPELYQMCVADEARLMAKLKQEVVRQMQVNENQRAEFGAAATQDFAMWWSWP